MTRRPPARPRGGEIVRLITAPAAASGPAAWTLPRLVGLRLHTLMVIAANVCSGSPNLQFHVQPLSLDRFGEPLHTFAAITISVCNLRPTSRGSVHAAGPDAKPRRRLIQPNYLATPEDERVAVEVIAPGAPDRRPAAAAAVPPLEEHRPGAAATSDAELLAAARALGTTIFHPVGTAKMGLPSDPYAVLDERLRVFGVERLRVADASAMPRITSGNTNSPTMMIAEKAARMIVEDEG